MDIDTFLKLATGSGVGVACLLAGVLWLNKAFNREHDARVTLLEESSKRCAEDRLALHAQVSELQKEVRALMRGMILSANNGCGSKRLDDEK